MSFYQAMTILISICSFGTTTFFAYLVYKLSKQGNELSQQANDIATELLAIQRQEIAVKVDIRNKSVKSEISSTNEKDITELNEGKQKLQQEIVTYKEAMKQLEQDEYKRWKQQNNNLKKHFLNEK